MVPPWRVRQVMELEEYAQRYGCEPPRAYDPRRLHHFRTVRAFERVSAAITASLRPEGDD